MVGEATETSRLILIQDKTYQCASVGARVKCALHRTILVVIFYKVSDRVFEPTSH
jgi:hypothetical protein